MIPCPIEAGQVCHAVSLIWIRGGWIGVDLFFVLSGFLVSGLLFSEYRKRSNVSVKRFLIRRAFKIYPPFYTLILITLGLTILSSGMIDPRGTVGELTFTQNYVGYLWGHTWSLAVEEHFYLLLAVGVYLTLRKQTKRFSSPFAKLPQIFGVIAWICLLLRLITVTVTPYPTNIPLYATHFRIDSLLFGVLLSYLWHFQNLRAWLERRITRYLLLGLGIALMLPPFFFELEETWWMPAVWVVCLYFGAGAILLSMLSSRTVAHCRICKILAMIGFYSYSIYLWHFPLERWFMPVVKSAFENILHVWNWPLYFVIYFSSAILLGIGMARLIEVPFLRLRDRLFPSRPQISHVA